MTQQIIELKPELMDKIEFAVEKFMASAYMLNKSCSQFEILAQQNAKIIDLLEHIVNYLYIDTDVNISGRGE